MSLKETLLTSLLLGCLMMSVISLEQECTFFLNETFLRFMSLKSYLSFSIFTSTGMTRGQGIIRVVVVVATFSDIFLRERERSLANAERKKKRILTF